MSPTVPRPDLRSWKPGRSGYRRLSGWIMAVLWAASTGPAMAQSGYQGRTGTADPCADLGSFAIVDALSAGRGQPLVAQPYQPCADLPGRPQPQVFIDAQVQVGGQQDQTATEPPSPGWRPHQRRR